MTLSEYWLLLDKSMIYTAFVSMCKMLSGIYELAVTAIVIMNLQEIVPNTFYTDNNTRI